MLMELRDTGPVAMDATIAAPSESIPAARPSDSRGPAQRVVAPAPPVDPRASGRVTARFVRQHEELSVVAKELLKSLDSIKIAEDPSTVRRMLATFSGKLRVHAAMEEEALYPRLLASTDPGVRDKARELLDEIGGLYDQFFQHLGKWSDGAAIKADPEGFCRDTMALLFRLKVRMKRENEELYPMVDGPSAA
ncbi:MAG: hemerythrin domain-containing protein [Polyangiaceae bacterium]